MGCHFYDAVSLNDRRFMLQDHVSFQSYKTMKL